MRTPDHTVINCIRRATNECRSALLDRTIRHDHDLHGGTNVLAFLESDKPSVTRDFDVPLRSVIALGRSDASGMTWRNGLFNYLHGDDWREDTIAYFDGPIGDKPFPAPGSSRPLQLVSYSGVTICSCGNHRLHAAYCWLIATKGDDSFLRSVNTRMQSLHTDRLIALMQLHRRGLEVSV